MLEPVHKYLQSEQRAAGWAVPLLNAARHQWEVRNDSRAAARRRARARSGAHIARAAARGPRSAASRGDRGSGEMATRPIPETCHRHYYRDREY